MGRIGEDVIGERKRCVVAGAGVGGLGAALALGRAGWDVTIVERDATPPPSNADDAFAWDRRGAPQVRHSHALLARLRNLLRDRYPDVLERLLDAGATEIRFGEMLPETLDDRSPQPGDEDLVALACRRTTFEMVLRHAVLAGETVTLLDGVGVEGLVADGRRVTGATLSDGRCLPADVVVGALGRRSAVPRWLSAIGVDVDETEEETGIVYLSRFYRLTGDGEFPAGPGPIGADLGYLKYGVFQGDNHTFSITLAVRTHDDELRAALLDPATFDLAARSIPAVEPWATAPVEAITPVNVMGGLLNRHLRFVDDGGEPLVEGFHAVGDAHTCTNPLYGRGCSLAMVQATLLADAHAEHPELRDAARAYEAACEREIMPWYHAAVEQDRMGRLARGIDDGDAPSESGNGDGGGDGDSYVDPAKFAFELMRDGLVPALQVDAVVLRAFIRTFNLLSPPDTIMTDPEVISRVLQSYQQRDERPPPEPLGPPRRELLAALSSA